MSDKKRHLNPLLLLIAILLCLSAGFLFRRTSFPETKGKRQHFCYTDHYGRAFCLSF